MNRRSIGRSVFALSFGVITAALLFGCPKKKETIVDDAALPAPSGPPDVLELAKLEDDAGPDADADADTGAKKVGVGGPVNTNQAKIRACCGAIRGQARTLGNSPEAFQLNALAATCDGIATQVGPGGNAPEFAQVRALLNGRTLPGGCSF